MDFSFFEWEGGREQTRNEGDWLEGSTVLHPLRSALKKRCFGIDNCTEKRGVSESVRSCTEKCI